MDAGDCVLRINDAISRLQKELRCGICCSTFQNPYVVSCRHVFCKSCIEECFKRQRKLHCPICRQVLDRRGNKDSYQITQAVQEYLKLSEAFKSDIEGNPTFAIPKEVAFMESQKPMDMTQIEENGGKRGVPEFVIPQMPMRKKAVARRSTEVRQVAKVEPIDAPVEVVPLKISNHVGTQAHPVEKEPTPVEVVPVKITSHTETQVQPETSEATCDAVPLQFTSQDLANFDMKSFVLEHMERSQEVCVLSAITTLFPTLQPLLKMIPSQKLMTYLGVENRRESVDSILKSAANRSNMEEKRVKFDENNVPGPSIRLIEEKENNAMDCDVVDSSGDGEEPQVVNERDKKRMSTCSVASEDATMRMIMDEEEAEELDLQRPPIIFSVSRLQSLEDKELVSEFFAQFLSNSCRFQQDIGPFSTHLVMMNSADGDEAPQKSLAYVQAVARKCTIVGRQWIAECVKTSTLTNPDNYALKSAGSTVSQIPTSQPDREEGWKLAKESEQRIFEGWKFLIIRRYARAKLVDYKSLIELVTTCGGTLIESPDEADSEVVVVFYQKSPALYEAEKLETERKCKIVTPDWILDSVSEFRMLPFERAALPRFHSFRRLTDRPNNPIIM